MNNWMILTPILLPILAGMIISIIPIFQKRKSRNACMMLGLIIECVMVFICTGKTGHHLTLFTLVDQIPIYFQIDELSVLFSMLIAVIWLLAGLFSLEYMKHEGDERRYDTFYLIAEGVLVGLSYAGNLVTLYLCFECMTLLTMPLVLYAKTKEAVRAARKYMFYSIFGASASLGGICILAVYAPSITFTAGGVFTAETFYVHESLYLIAAAIMIVGFCGKAGIFPLHGWLPTAHPQAPSPASAVMSGVITKMGVLSSIRTAFYVFGAEFLRGTWVQTLWMSLALITIFLGSMMAYKEPLMKRRFAYSTVSQVSYILLGLSTMTVEGMTGGLLHIVFHAVCKTTLFLMSGAVIYYSGKTKVKELAGIGKQMPAVMICYTLASVALVGIPPTSAFVSKEFLAHGVMETGMNVLFWLGPVVLLISAVLTAGYLLTIAIDGFYLQKVDARSLKRYQVDWKISLPMWILAVLSVLMGVWPKPLIELAGQISSMLL